MSGKRVAIGGVVLLLAAAAGALVLVRRSQAPGKPAARPAPSAVVIGPEASLTGKVRAQTVISIAAPVNGTVQELLVENGQPVFEGQLLGRIENTGLETEQQQATTDAARAQERLNQLQNELISARLEASRARADANRAQAGFDRSERSYLREQMLNREGATPRMTYEKALAEYQAQKAGKDSLTEVARLADERLSSLVNRLDAQRKTVEERNALVDQARESASAAEIRSPVDGLLLTHTKQVGDEVTTEIPDLFHIAVNLSALEVVLEPEPPVLARVRPGQEALVHTPELPNPIPARVKEIQGTQVIVEFTSPDPSLLPGATAQVRIKLT